jgi:hypothetical protein
MRARLHPMRGPNRLKLGIFSANADGGLALTRAPVAARRGLAASP